MSKDYVIAVDPGVGYFAEARFAAERLISVNLVRGKACHVPHCVFALVMEKPQVYASGRARKSDIVDLAIAAGRIAQALGADMEVWYTPAQWKGQIKKGPHHARIRSRLDEKELALLAGLPQKELVHILDAVGLGLFHLGRI